MKGDSSQLAFNYHINAYIYISRHCVYYIETKSILSQIGWNHTNPCISRGTKCYIISKQNSRFVVTCQSTEGYQVHIQYKLGFMYSADADILYFLFFFIFWYFFFGIHWSTGPIGTRPRVRRLGSPPPHASWSYEDLLSLPPR